MERRFEVFAAELMWSRHHDEDVKPSEVGEGERSGEALLREGRLSLN